MIGLLVDLPQPGYPADYLLARLPARRARWPELLAPAAGDGAQDVWTALAAEWRWLYGQLSRRLRLELAPLFLYRELKPLFLFLRGLAVQRAEEARELLATTLLAEDLKHALLGEEEVAMALQRLGQHWPGDGGSKHLPTGDGLAAVEQGMTRQLLENATRSRTALRPLWEAMIDLENLMALAKRLRWQARHPFRYQLGGSLDQRRLRMTEEGNTPAWLGTVAAPFHAAVQESVWPLEEMLIARVSQRLRRLERPLAPAMAVATYMWGALETARQLTLARAAEVRA